MTILCFGALTAGLIAASILPFLPFACAVVFAIVVGFVSMMIGGSPVAQTSLSALALLVASQIGYGLGVIATAVVVQGAGAVRRGTPDKQTQPVQPLQTGNEPR